MTFNTSGTTSFTLPIDELFDEANERLGGEPDTNPKTNLRTLNLLFTDWQNRGVNLWTLRNVLTTLTAGTASYTLTADTEDVVYGTLRTVTSAGASVTNLDTAMTRIGYGEYLALPNKATQGRPSQYFVDRQLNAPIVYLYLTPNTTGSLFNHWQLRWVQDAGALRYDTDTPRRMWPAMVAGLAYHLGQKRLFRTPGALDRLAFLKTEYEETLQRAMEEDRERTSLLLRPTRRRRR